MPLAYANECDDLCVEKGFDFGACKDTIEDGFCEGDTDETVFGFSQCTDLQRCCCGYEKGSETPDETTEDSTGFTMPEISVASGIFWILLVIVLMLLVAIYYKGKGKKEVKEE